MKYILTLFMLFGFAKAQLYVNVYDESIHQNKTVLYVPQQVLNVSGITKTQLDSVATSLKNSINTSFNNLQVWATNTFALKGSAATVLGMIINITEKQEGLEFRTEDYGKTYNGIGTVGSLVYGGYSDALTNNQSAGNLTSLFNDKPWRVWAYNANSDRTRRFSRGYSYGRWFEPMWYNPTLGGWTIEDHLANLIDTLGNEHRIISINSNFGNGNTIMMMETSSLALYAKAAYQFLPGFNYSPYFFANSAGQITIQDAEGNNSQLILRNGKSGKTMLFGQAGDLPVIDIQKSSVGDNRSYFHYDGFGHLKMIPDSFYGSNQEAINNGLQKGDSYWTRINGIKVLAQVE